MSDIFKQWKSNVINHPEKMKLDFEWTDTITGWSVWAANGYWFYDLRSPEGGKFELSLLEKWKMGNLLKWWIAGSLQRSGKLDDILFREDSAERWESSGLSDR